MDAIHKDIAVISAPTKGQEVEDKDVLESLYSIYSPSLRILANRVAHFYPFAGLGDVAGRAAFIHHSPSPRILANRAAHFYPNADLEDVASQTAFINSLSSELRILANRMAHFS